MKDSLVQLESALIKLTQADFLATVQTIPGGFENVNIQNLRLFQTERRKNTM